ncbi:MAG: hypothetical protein K0R08_1220 [Solimicrobium sp.]|nr:hypothetical protein [Solimicrobium sp.]
MDISAQAIARQYKAPDGVSMSNYGANKYNDLGNSFLEYFVYIITCGQVLLSERIDPSIQVQLDKLNGEILEELEGRDDRTVGNFCKKLTNDLTLTMVEINGGVQVTIASNNGIKASFSFIENMCFKKMRHNLLGHTSINREELGTKPQKVISQLLHPHRSLPIITIDKRGDKTQPKIEEQPCPGGHDSIKIFAGTTFNGVSEKNALTISDSATVVFFNDMCVASVVDGGKNTTAKESQTYGALITAAALQTVQESNKHANLSDKDIQTIFFDTINNFQKLDIFPKQNINFLRVTFAGVALYRDSEGKLKQFSYGLGHTALASTSSEGIVTTHHLQSDLGHHDGEERLLALNSDCVKHQDITAKISDVDPNTATFQLMTDGCQPAYFASDGDNREILRCKSALPNHGEFNPEALIDSAGLNRIEARSPKGDDVLHLSIDVNKAVKEMERMNKVKPAVLSR